MLFNCMYKLGRGLYENREDIHVGCNTLSAQYAIVLNSQGELVEIAEWKNRRQVWNPVSFLGDRFSDAESRYYAPHLIFGKIIQLIDGQYLQRYISNIRWLKSRIIDWRIEAIYSFLEKEQEMKRVTITETNASYVYAFVNDKGERNELWEDEDFKRKIDDLFIDNWRSMNGKRFICDVTGINTHAYIKVHARMNTGTPCGGRALSRTLYSQFYYDGVTNGTSICNIGSETEAFANVGFYYVMKLKRPMNYRRWFYLGDVEGRCYFPICGTLKEWEEAYGISIETLTDWMDLKKIVLRDMAGRGLIFAEFGDPNQGRLSTYRALEYSVNESVEIVKKILKWFELVFFEDGIKVSYYGLSYIFGVNVRGEDVDYKSKMYSDYMAYLISGSYERIIMKYWLPWLDKEPANWRRTINKASEIIREVHMGEYSNDGDYLAGVLFGLMSELEHRYNWLMGEKVNNYVRKRFTRFLRRPFAVWCEVSRRIEFYAWQMDGKGDYFYNKIQDILYRLQMEFDFEHMPALSEIAILGLNSVIVGQKNRRRSKENEEL